MGILEIKSHPNFGRRATFDYDFALLRLKHPMDFTLHRNIRTVCMPEKYYYIGKNIAKNAISIVLILKKISPSSNKILRKNLLHSTLHNPSYSYYKKFKSDNICNIN